MKKLVPFLVLVLSCASETRESIYYDSGELRYEVFDEGENCSFIKAYYKDGSEESVGKYCDSLKHGDFIEYFTDGSIKWKGRYEQGLRVYEANILDDLNCSLQFSFDKGYEVNKENTVAIHVGGMIHPKDILVAVTAPVEIAMIDSLNQTVYTFKTLRDSVNVHVWAMINFEQHTIFDTLLFRKNIVN